MKRGPRSDATFLLLAGPARRVRGDRLLCLLRLLCVPAGRAGRDRCTRLVPVAGRDAQAGRAGRSDRSDGLAVVLALCGTAWHAVGIFLSPPPLVCSCAVALQ